MTGDESEKLQAICVDLDRVAAILLMIGLAAERAGRAADIECAIDGATSYLRLVTADVARLTEGH